MAGTDDTTETSAVVAMIELPAADLARARDLKADIVILPRRRAEDGRGIYGEATLFLAKELRAEGVEVAYLDTSTDRLFEVKHSALVTSFATLVLGIGSNAGWAGIKKLLRREHNADELVEVAYSNLAADGSEKNWKITGNAEDVIKIIDKLLSEPPEAAS